MKCGFVFLCVSMFVLFYGCKDKHKKEVARMVKQWQGKKVSFPDNTVFTIFGQDTVPYRIPKSGCKLLMYADSAGCTDCKLHLSKWKDFISEITLINKDFPVLFFFYPKNSENKQELTYLLKNYKINTPVCIDPGDSLNKRNGFPKNQDFQCFLLNGENKVIVIGNPIQNEKIKAMYVSQIRSCPHSHP